RCTGPATPGRGPGSHPPPAKVTTSSVGDPALKHDEGPALHMAGRGLLACPADEGTGQVWCYSTTSSRLLFGTAYTPSAPSPARPSWIHSARSMPSAIRFTASTSTAESTARTLFVYCAPGTLGAANTPSAPTAS